MNFCTLLCAFCFMAGTLAAQTTLQDLDKNLQRIYKKSDFPGFAVGMVKNDSVLFSKAYGFANVNEKVPFTEHTIMPVGSVSKTVIALALAKAMELKYFDDETPINAILPFEMINPHRPDDTIKVKHLFTHTSGILDNEVTFLNTYQLRKTPDTALGEYIERCLHEDGPLYSPANFDQSKTGSTYNYSNIGSALAAYLIELKANMSFDAFTQHYIFEPLGLHSTHWFYDEGQAKNYATLYEVNVPDLPNFNSLMNADKSVKIYSSIIYPDGSLKTSLHDLIRYTKEIINGHQHQSNLLQPQSYDAIFAERFEEGHLPDNSSKNMINQAMFWTYNRKGRLVHTGSDPGVFAVVSIDPATNIGRIVMINANIDTDDNQKLLQDLKAISDTLDSIE